MADDGEAARPDLSIVVPMHNEAENVEPLHDELVAVLGELGRAAELIFVDDGSTDDTFDRLEAIHGREQVAKGLQVKVLRLRRRFGKSAALSAGFDASRGDIVLTLDGDLQDDPREIPRFLEKLEEGCDLVSGWKRERHDPLTKVVASRVFNFVVSLASGIELHDFNCGYKAYRAEVVRELRLYGGLHRYVPVLAAAKGYRCGEVVVRHRPRQHGGTKYGLARLATGPLDLLTVLLLTGYASRPLHFFGGLGLVAFAAGLLIDLLEALLWLAGVELVGRAPAVLLGVLLMMLGTQLVAVGLLGELLSSRQSGGQKPYSIAQHLG